MQSVVVIILLLGTLTFALKLSLRRPLWWWLWAVVAAVATGLAWPLAAAQSKTQIADFLQNPALMADAAVMITLEVALMVAYCWSAVGSRQSAIGRRRWMKVLLEFFPGVVFFLTLFSLLTYLLFTLTGASFPLVSWGMAAGILLLVPTLAWLFRWLLPEGELRLELLFVLNLIIGALGIVATVNGRTAVRGIASPQWPQLASVVALCLAAAAVGLLLYRKKKKHRH